MRLSDQERINSRYGITKETHKRESMRCCLMVSEAFVRSENMMLKGEPKSGGPNKKFRGWS
jgi:hypothetical protein